MTQNPRTVQGLVGYLLVILIFLAIAGPALV